MEHILKRFNNLFIIFFRKYIWCKRSQHLPHFRLVMEVTRKSKWILISDKMVLSYIYKAYYLIDVFFITRFFFRPSGSREGYKRSRFSQCWYWIFRCVILKKLFNFVWAKTPDFMVKITLKNSCFYIYLLQFFPQACLINATLRSSKVNYV